MDANNTPEQPPNVDQGKLAAQVAHEIISKIREINASGDDKQQQDQQKSDLAAEILNENLQVKERLERLREAEKSGTASAETQEKIKKEQQKLGLSLIKACTLADNDVQVSNNPEANRVLRELSKTQLSDTEASEIQESIGDYLLGGKTIIISKSREAKSDFMKGVDNLAKKDLHTAEKLMTALVMRAPDFGMDAEGMKKVMIENFSPATSEDNSNPLNQQEEKISTGNPKIDVEVAEAGLGNDIHYYRSKFNRDQLNLIQTFYSPTAFIEYMEQLSDNKASDGTIDPQKVLAEKAEVREHIKHYYEQNPTSLKEGENLEQKIDKEFEIHWGEKVSNQMRNEVSDIVNHLFLVLQLKAPHKYYREILQEADPFYGPAPVLNKIQTAITGLMTRVAQIERKADKNDPLYKKLENLKLFRHQEQDSYIDERDGKKYPRIKPIAIGKSIHTSEFLENLGMLIDHTTHKDEYFLNSRAIYKHPAGEKGFYHQLGELADGSLAGVDLDEILMLPDGQYVLEAYQLYEKFLKEDFSSLDWKHRPDQFQAQLESVNSKLELEMIKNLQNFYPDFTDMRIRSIVNSAIGMSRGMTLSEPETSAYADPVDAEGRGMVASYSTNDAQSLNVFNSLHNALRWQGEHNWNLMYFMPVEGRRRGWDHNEAHKNQARYMESFKPGVGRGSGKEKLPELFVDVLANINKVGGPQGMRKGWRNEYAFNGHFVFKPNSNTIDAFETFKALEAIGYEGVSSFIETNKAGNLLKAMKGDTVIERKNLFRYIYKRYICDDPSKFQESDLDNYLAKLRKTGEERALKHIRGEYDEPEDRLHVTEKDVREKGKPIINDASWEEQVTYATSQIFMESTLAHYTAARMPTLLLKIGRNRLTENGISRREQAMRDLKTQEGWSSETFSKTMKDFGLVEMLFRRQISGKIREEMSFNENFGLNQTDKISDLPYRLDATKIGELLLKNSKDEKFKSPEEVERVIKLWEYMKADFFKNGNDGKSYLDEKAFKEIKGYPFTIGLEDTDMSLVAYRGTGPRMVARAIKDIASIEANITSWLTNVQNILPEIAINGKHDISTLIEYLRKGQKAIFDVHGSEAAQEFIYKISGMVMNYFRQDVKSRGLLGLFGLRTLGKRNSMAAEYAGRSTAVWEWDSRDNDRWVTALESYRLLPMQPYDLSKTEDGKFTGGKLEDRWIINPFTKKPMKFNWFGKKRHVDFIYNSARLRKEHGADWKAITGDMLNQFLPLAIAFLLWKYIKDAMDEASGKKKQ